MQSNIRNLVLVFLFVGAILTACNLPRRTTSGPGNVYTQIAPTFSAQLTQSVIQTVIALATQSAFEMRRFLPLVDQVRPPTSIPPTDTLTPLPPTATRPTDTPSPSNTPTPIPCNKAQFIKDITLPDGTVLTPGSQFTKVWRIENVGSCAWGPDYDLVITDGTTMTTQPAVPLTGIVQPHEVVDITVKLTAPTQDGRYRSDYMLRAPDGKLFGVGSAGDKSFWVIIQVLSPTSSGQPTLTSTLTPTLQPSNTPTITLTVQPSITPTLTLTPQSSYTPTLTLQPSQSAISFNDK
jgi:hypothetical protein